MKHAPFRLLFFLAALVALGVYAAAVTIPHMFSAGDPIVAEEVNENLATLASAVEAVEVEVDTLTDEVEAGLRPREVVVAAPTLAVEEVGLPTTVVTTADGRWNVNVGFEGFTLCGTNIDVRFFLIVDDVPVASTVLYADQNDGIRARLWGPTERVLPAGQHELRVGTECVGPETVDAAVLSVDDAYSIVVLPE